jgi:hypothetical protein
MTVMLLVFEFRGLKLAFLAVPNLALLWCSVSECCLAAFTCSVQPAVF